MISSGKITILRFEDLILLVVSAYLKALPLPHPETLDGSMLKFISASCLLPLPTCSVTISCLCPSRKTIFLNPSPNKDSIHISINFLPEISSRHLGKSIPILLALPPAITTIWVFAISS